MTCNKWCHPKHPAFQIRAQPVRWVDRNPHTFTDEDREHTLMAMRNGHGASIKMTRKLIRLYDERATACHQLMRQLGLLPDDHDPEKG